MTTYFRDFLEKIRLTDNQNAELKSAHTTLRKRLQEDEGLSEIVETTFLQGSYRRATAVRPKNGNRSDVDIVVVTKVDKGEVTPEEALDLFEPFLEKWYEGKYQKQGRSWGIQMTHVDLDIVPTSAPSIAESNLIKNELILSDYNIEEMEEKAKELNESNWLNNTWYQNYQLLFESQKNETWKNEPLYIPDREAEIWDKTHPLEQIRWTQEKNKNCNGHFVNIVKCLKWWRKEKYPEDKHPKSYPLEHFAGDCCPDDVESVAEGITRTLEAIVNYYPLKPNLPDRGVPEHDVFERLSETDYNKFYKSVCDAAIIARQAYDAETVEESAKLWGGLFGNKFPEPPKKESAGFTKRNTDSRDMAGGRFA